MSPAFLDQYVAAARKAAKLAVGESVPKIASAHHVKTKGDDKSPVYKFLTEKYGEPKWNFHKYLVGKDGQVIRAFGAKVQPEDPELRAAIDAALAK